MAMVGRQRPYLSYLLRLWLVEGNGPVWRASLEAPGSAERHGFATLEQLIAFLVAETNDMAAEENWESRASKGERKEVAGPVSDRPSLDPPGRLSDDGR